MSPLDPEIALFLGAIAVAHYTAEALRLWPGFQGAERLRCASLAQAGRLEEARTFLAMVRHEQPELSIDWVRANVP